MAAHWKMDEGAGETLTDETGQYRGKIERAEWVAGHSGKGLRFDGDGVVTIKNADSLPATTNYSWMAWIKTTKGGTIMARGGAGKQWAPGGRALFLAENDLTFYAAFARLVKAEVDIYDDRWHHVAVTVGAQAGQDTITFYVDGKAIANAPNVPGSDEEGHGMPIKIGYCINGFPQGQSGFVGVIDDFRWYKYAISADMVKQIFEGGL